MATASGYTVRGSLWTDPPAPERKPQAVGGAQWGATGVPLHSLRCVVG